jgi:hypothetical protein
MTKYDTETEKEIDDPRFWEYQLLIHSTQEFDYEFENWEIVIPSRPAKGIKGLWISKYASKIEPWEELIECIKEDRELKSIVERMVPDKAIQTNIFRTARNHRYFANPNNKPKSVSVVKGGGTRLTKYEYPHDCISKKDRSKYRRDQRKKNAKST